MRWLLLFAGGGLGAVLRFALALWVDGRAATAFPWGTFAVNTLGCLLIGLLATAADLRAGFPAELRLFLVAGLLGGFTTFSTFGLETWRLVADGAWPLAFANAAGSVLAGLTGVMLGVVLGRQLAA